MSGVMWLYKLVIGVICLMCVYLYSIILSFIINVSHFLLDFLFFVSALFSYTVLYLLPLILQQGFIIISAVKKYHYYYLSSLTCPLKSQINK